MTARALLEDLVDDPKLLALVDTAFDYRDAAVRPAVSAAGLDAYNDAADRLATLVTAACTNADQAGRTLLAVLELLAYLAEAHDHLANPTAHVWSSQPPVETTTGRQLLPGEIPLPLEDHR